MMNRLNLASLALLFGAVGQSLLYGALFPRLPSWPILAVVYVPWLTVFTISFCRQAPFGPRLFRHCLVFAMSWYATNTAVAEILYFLIRPAPFGHFPNSLAQVLICFGMLSFVVFIRACAILRGLENLENKEIH